eukprot:scaffold13268_cov135-Cylindrotheca_fusiformis.AAC.2
MNQAFKNSDDEIAKEVAEMKYLWTQLYTTTEYQINKKLKVSLRNTDTVFIECKKDKAKDYTKARK